MAPLPQYRNALPLQSSLHEYRLEQVLGAGGFGMTYLARDTHLDKQVAIKEYLPSELAMRAPGGTVQAVTTQREPDYRWGLERFLLEARTLAKFSHPHIVRVIRYFEANGTAYMVMDYERGDPLKNVLILNPEMPEAELKGLLAPLLEGLSAVHAAGFLHRDIKPDNIFIRADGTPVLIDFGAARNALGGETRSLTAILTPGFAPLEQYSGEGRQGPWTDLYAMGGVLYRAVTGQNPPDAVTRMRADTVGGTLAKAGGRCSPGFLRAIEWALALDEKKRPQSVEQWRGALFEQDYQKTLVQKPPQEKRMRWFAYAAAIALIALLAAAAMLHQRPAREEAAKAGPAAATAVQEKIQRFRREAEAEFRAADANGDGYLSSEEVRARFPGIAREFARADADGDGRISVREFLQFRRLQFERRMAKQAD